MLSKKMREFLEVQETATLRKLVILMSVANKNGSEGWMATVLFLRETLPKEDFLSIMKEAK